MSYAVRFTDPKLCSYGGDLSRAWFIYFDITNDLTGETQRKQLRAGINYGTTEKQRISAAKGLMKAWLGRLQQGWNPWGISQHQALPDLSLMCFHDAMDFALSKCKVGKATKRAYRTTTQFVQEAAIMLQLSQIRMSLITRQRIKLILEECQQTHRWTGAAYNKHLCYLKALLGRLEEWEVIEYNPATKIQLQAVAETQKFIPLTAEEKQTLQETLFIQHYPFFVYLMMIYHTGIRPKEILALRIRDINLSLQLITIMPDLEEENSKTRKIRRIPINNFLVPFLREMQLGQFDPSWYVFGSPFAAGIGNRGKGQKGASSPEYFKPSLVQIKRDTATRLWQKIIRKTLKIDKYQYALKHTGGDDKILAGVDLDALKELYGHSSKFMTEKYAGKVKEVYRSMIVEKSPDFCPVLQNKKALEGHPPEPH